jgi:hypothetical protein
MKGDFPLHTKKVFTRIKLRSFKGSFKIGWRLQVASYRLEGFKVERLESWAIITNLKQMLNRTEKLFSFTSCQLPIYDSAMQHTVLA